MVEKFGIASSVQGLCNSGRNAGLPLPSDLAKLEVYPGAKGERRMHRTVIYGLAALIGLVLGPLLMLPGFSLSSQVEVDGWTSNWSIGSEQANPYLRAYVAVFGLLALTKEEAVYFNQSSDSDGRPLLETCTYKMTGGDQPARWWSITLYDKDGYLPLNEDAALSMDATRAAGQDWRVIIAPEQPDDETAHWVSSRSVDTFDLTLRLYEPTPEMLSNPVDALNPPVIQRISCQEDAP